MSSPWGSQQATKVLGALLVDEALEHEEDALYEELATVVLIASCLLLAENDDTMSERIVEEVRGWGGSRPGRAYCAPKWLVNWASVEARQASMSATTWKDQFGVTKQLFNRIVADLTPALPEKSPAFRTPIPANLAVAVALGRLRHGHSLRCALRRSGARPCAPSPPFPPRRRPRRLQTSCLVLCPPHPSRTPSCS